METIVSECAYWSKDAYTLKLASVLPDDEHCYYLHDPGTDAQAFVIQETERTIVAFRGSTTTVDWLHDFQIWRKSARYLKNAWVHAGFLKQYDTLRDQILSKIQRDKPIICCGHSLGGALSTIAALDLSLNSNKNTAKPLHVTCCTFGSPRVGSAFFRTLFDKHVNCSKRCVFKKDPITFTPLPIRFRHVAGVQYFDENGLLSKESKESQSDECRCLVGCSAGHHSLDMYILGIKTNAVCTKGMY